MTGIYVRIQRGGTFENVEFDQCTDAELETFAASQPVEKGWPWACTLAAWIRDHVRDQPEDDDA